MNIKQIFTAIALTLCILSAAVVVTLNFRPLYYMDIHHFNLPEKTGYPEEEIREIMILSSITIPFSIKKRWNFLPLPCRKRAAFILWK